MRPPCASPRRSRTACALLSTLMLLGSCGEESTTDVVTPSECPDPTDPVAVGVPGFPAVSAPADNPQSVQGIALGRRLFHDPILSRDGSQSCATCHQPAFAFSDGGRRFSVGIDGIEGSRNAPALANVAWNVTSFWDGRAASLEEQVIGPVENPIEMAETWDHVVDKLQNHPEYPQLFCEVFGTSEITQRRVIQAIAQFERTFVSNNSRYDRWLRGELQLSPAEQRGFDLIKNSEQAECQHCHTIEPSTGSNLLTDLDFHDIGLDSVAPDPGRGAVTGKENDLGKFKTPTLRNVALTAPYMHDGRLATLEDVLAHYSTGVEDSRNVDPLLRPENGGLQLTEGQQQDIIAFLHALTDTTFVNNPAFRAPEVTTP